MSDAERAGEKKPEDMDDVMLSQAVAEEVMGWTWRRIDPGHSRDHLCPPGFVPYTNVETFPPKPRFADDIAAAWEVVEKINNFDTIISKSGREGDDSWYARLDYCDGHEPHTGRSAATAPRAICEAAIAAVRTPKPERSGG